MTYARVPSHSKKKINKAGKKLASGALNDKERDELLGIVNSWRSSHNYPINTFQALLRTKLRKFKGGPIVAQRLKRMPTIIDKLVRYPTMQVTTMQDIGGIRAIVDDMVDLNNLAKQYRGYEDRPVSQRTFKHQLHNEVNHIENPRPEDGYRSLHFIYRYKNNQSELAKEYEGHFIELQIRTKMQHYWATAVETMGTFLGQSLKTRQGDEKWLKFFAMTSSAFAYLEGTSPVFPKLSKKETFDSVKRMARELDVVHQMESLSLVAKHLDNKKWSYHLIVLDSFNRSVHVDSYSRDDLEKANSDYLEYEKRAVEGEKIEPVLVSAGPIEELKKAYPNFFLDTKVFITNLKKILSS